MKDNFSRCLTYVLNTEGGFVDDPRDPGGRTNHGVTQATYDKWRATHRLPQRDVRLISEVEVAAIYSSEYWTPCRCDDLPTGADYCVFDYAINSGDTTSETELEHAARDLQAAVNVTIDGVIGPVTLAAVKLCDPAKLIDQICDDRLVYLRHLKRFPIYGKGWTNRVEAVREKAKEMAA